MRKHPLQFRKEEIYEVMMRFRASESASLIGVGSVGKSNLLHHMIDRDTIDYYLGDRSKKFFPIMIDPNLLGPTDGESVQFKCWAGYELLMHRMFLALHPFDMLDNDAENFYKTYRELQDGSNPLHTYMGLRYFELGLEYFFRREYQIVFLFDEFEELLRAMPIKFFLTLRGLRDMHKKQLSFLTFSREPIPVLVKKMEINEMEVEPFTELFTDNNYFVGPYNQDDANAMIQTLLERNPNPRISQHAVTFLMNATGRFAGIMRASFRELEILGEISPVQVQDSDLIERLARRNRVQAECETIWKSLTDSEQIVIKNIVNHTHGQINDESERAISLLVQKKLLHVDRQTQTLRIEPPVFNCYVHSVV